MAIRILITLVHILSSRRTVFWVVFLQQLLYLMLIRDIHFPHLHSLCINSVASKKKMHTLPPDFIADLIPRPSVGLGTRLNFIAGGPDLQP